MAENELDVLVVGGGVVGAGSALDAVTRGLTTAIVEARDVGERQRQAGQRAKLHPRGVALPGDARLPAGAGGPEGARPADPAARAAPAGVKPVPFLYPLKHRVWDAGLRGGRGGALHGRDGLYAIGRNRARAAPPPAPDQDAMQALREAPCLRQGPLLTGADPVLGTPRMDDVPGSADDLWYASAACRFRRARGEPGQGDRLPAPGRAGRRSARVTDLETGGGVRGPRQAGHQRHRRGGLQTTRRRWPTPVASSTLSARRWLHPPRGAARPAAVQHGPHPADREERPVRHPIWGRHWIIGSASPTPIRRWNLAKDHSGGKLLAGHRLHLPEHRELRAELDR